MKKIGVSACFMYPDKERIVFGPKSLSYLENDMAQYLAQQKVMPVLIPDLEDEQLVPFLKEMDGFVFQGGTDIAPQTYGDPPNSRWPGDLYRDQYELKILDFAIKKEKAVLGICRGFQLLNVYFGGTLYQDIETGITHRDAYQYDKLTHDIRFSPNLLLDRLHQNRLERTVNSVHHQGVKKLGSNLEVLAESIEDNLIEAFQWTQAPAGKVMGVQWHPEFFRHSEGELIDGDLIYHHFLEFC